MIAPECVQGVQGCAGLCFSTQHALSPRISGAVGFRVACAGLSCAQAYVHAFFLRAAHPDGKKHHASTEKAYTPCTPYTKQHKYMIYIGFICVGFVLCCGSSVLSSVFRGEGR